MPQLSEIHAELNKPTLFDKLRDHTAREADQLLSKGKTMYVAKKTFDTLPSDVRTTLPSQLQEKLSSLAWPAFTSMLDRMIKQASVLDAARAAVPGAINAVRTAVPSVHSAMAKAPGAIAGAVRRNPVAATELGGLGVLAVPGMDTVQASARAHLAGDKSHDAVERRQLLGEGAHAALDVGGLGILMGPEARHLLGKHAGIGVGAGMTTSQYSGPLSLGAFKMVSGIPAFNNPELEMRPEKKQASAFLDECVSLMKSAGGMNTATGAMHAAGRLHATQSVGAPKTTAPAGPSIAQVSKPKGYGEPIAGAKKNLL